MGPSVMITTTRFSGSFGEIGMKGSETQKYKTGNRIKGPVKVAHHPTETEKRASRYSP